jgi:hypothetical protein
MEVVRVCSQICENPIRDDNKPCRIHPPITMWILWPSPIMVGLWLGFTLMIMHPRPRRPFDHHAVCEVWGTAGGLLGRTI